MSAPATPAEAEELAKKAVGDYLTACRMADASNLGNYLMKLASVTGVMMAQAEGSVAAWERLQDISEADALAEGIVPGYGGFGLADGSHFHAADPRQSYFSLWEAINGPGSVEAAPWVWVVSLRRHHG